MKILMVNKFLYPNGGSETYIFKIGEYLIAHGHEVQYFGMEHKGRIVGNHAECYTQDMDFHTGKLQKLLYPLQILYSTDAKKKMRVVLEDFQPDVVHLNNFNFQLTPSIIYAVKAYEKAHGCKVKIVFTAHDYQLLCPNHMMLNHRTETMCEKCITGKFGNCTRDNCIHGSKVKSLLGTMEGYLYKMLGTYRYIDEIICPSAFIKEKFDENPIFAGKTIAMHNFIEVAKEPSDAGTAGMKSENTEGAPGELDIAKPYVVYFGRYASEKGIQTLLNVCRKCPEIPFIFAGNGPLEKEVNQVDNIQNVGFQSGQALRKLIQNATFAIMPSEWYENCPFSVMEAQMYGTPVLGARIGGIPELIDEGKTGELFTAGDADDLLDHVQVLWQNREKIEQYSKNCGNMKFDTLEMYCEKLLNIYDHIGG